MRRPTGQGACQADTRGLPGLANQVTKKMLGVAVLLAMRPGWPIYISALWQDPEASAPPAAYSYDVVPSRWRMAGGSFMMWSGVANPGSYLRPHWMMSTTCGRGPMERRDAHTTLGAGEDGPVPGTVSAASPRAGTRDVTKTRTRDPRPSLEPRTTTPGATEQ